MKEKKMIRYRIPVSRTFPATHPRAGEQTNFVDKIEGYWWGDGESWEKIHTIRANFPLWEKRFEKINRGEAVLELYYWMGKPYNSKTVVICRLGKQDGIGVQKLGFYCEDVECPYPYEADGIANNAGDVDILAYNDGLTFRDFKAWFKGYDLSKPMAIIHFTSFRY